jgi:dihydrofolate synthase / folylpolyglutamate synthase
MNYNQAVEFLFSQLPAYHRIGKAAYKSNLHNTLVLDEYFGRPHSKYTTIHIAGTNGKGSVSHMIASVLMDAGYKTGLYTSPHLKEFRERIKVNGRMITKKSVTGFIEKHSSILMSLKPSFFEMTVAMAFEYFAHSGCDIAVIETGLGGRLDSTNIIIPVLSVITNIGHDHMDLLGNSIDMIAREKAGIIKKGVPVVISETQEETKQVFIEKALETGSEIYFADQNFSCILNDLDLLEEKRGYTLWDKLSQKSVRGDISIGGDYQSKNIQAVFQSFRTLQGIIEFKEENITGGISNVVASTMLKGRWQIVGRKPLMICDTGHNREGLEYVINQLGKIPCHKLHIILGFVSDKDRNSLLPLFPSSATYYFTKASVPRALDEKILMAEAVRWNLKGSSYPSVKSAIAAAKRNSSEDDLIFIGGSTFVVGDAL